MAKKTNRKQPKSPLKTPAKRVPSFGKVQNLGATTLRHMEMRSVLKFMRGRHPEWSKAQMARETACSLNFVKKHWNNENIEDCKREGRPRTARTPKVMKALADSRGRLSSNSNRKNATKFPKKYNFSTFQNYSDTNISMV